MYWWSVPNFPNRQTVESTTVNSSARPDIKYTWMSSSVYQDMINLIVISSGDVQVYLWALYEHGIPVN